LPTALGFRSIQGIQFSGGILHTDRSATTDRDGINLLGSSQQEYLTLSIKVGTKSTCFWRSGVIVSARKHHNHSCSPSGHQQ